MSLLYDVKEKKKKKMGEKKRGSATFPAALFTVLRKKWERGSLWRGVFVRNASLEKIFKETR